MIEEFDASKNIDSKNQSTAANFSFKAKSGKINLIDK